MFDVVNSFEELDKVVKTGIPTNLNPFEYADKVFVLLKPWQVLVLGAVLYWAFSNLWDLVDRIFSE